MEVILKPLTWDNVDDVIVNSDSGTKFYDLPRNEDEAYWRLSLVENHRRHNRGDWFNAYDLESPTQLVGGGQFYDQGEAIDLGWWVVKSLRQRGFGITDREVLFSGTLRDKNSPFIANCIIHSRVKSYARYII